MPRGFRNPTGDAPPSPWPTMVVVNRPGRLYGPFVARRIGRGSEGVGVPYRRGFQRSRNHQISAMPPTVRRDAPVDIRHRLDVHGDGGASPVGSARLSMPSQHTSGPASLTSSPRFVTVPGGMAISDSS